MVATRPPYVLTLLLNWNVQYLHGTNSRRSITCFPLAVATRYVNTLRYVTSPVHCSREFVISVKKNVSPFYRTERKRGVGHFFFTKRPFYFVRITFLLIDCYLFVKINMSPLINIKQRAKQRWQYFMKTRKARRVGWWLATLIKSSRSDRYLLRYRRHRETNDDEYKIHGIISCFFVWRDVISTVLF